MSNKMSGKPVAEAIKRGISRTELMEKYGISSAELDEFIAKVYKKPDGLMSTLEKNEKKYQALLERKAKTAEEVPQGDAEGEVPEPELDEDLDAKAKRLSDEAFELDQRHKEIVRERKEILDSLVETRRELKEILRTLKETEKSVESREAKGNELGRSMNEIAKQYSAVMNELYVVKEQIAERDKVFILVSKEGVIEVYQNDYVVVVETDGWKARRDFMYDDESGTYDDLSKTQLGTLAKLYIITEHFVGFRIEYELDGQFEALRGFLVK